MKKFRLIIYMFIFFICLVHVNARTVYKEVPKFVNDYIKKFPNYQKYIVTENTRYGFTNGIIDNGTNDFKTGGLLNLDEYLISKSVGNNSYLFNGLEFFTMTKRNSKIVAIDPNEEDNLTELTVNDSSGIRVTNYINSSVKLNGTGSSVNPWTIISKYTVQFHYDDEKLSITPSSVIADEEGRTPPVTITPQSGYRYISNDCGATYSDNKLTVDNVTNDIVCNVEAAARGYQLTVYANGGILSPTNGWELSLDLQTATKDISYGEKISVLPTISRTGYIFAGWFTELTGGSQIDENTIMRDALDIYARWQARDDYVLTYNNNGGSGCTSQTGTYNSPWGNLCTPSRDGYSFKEWNTSADGTGTVITGNSIVNGNKTVYAIWNAKDVLVTLDPKGGNFQSVSGSTLSYGWTLVDSVYSYQGRICSRREDGTYSVTDKLIEYVFDCPSEFTTCDESHIGTYRVGTCTVKHLNDDEVKAIKQIKYNSPYSSIPTPVKNGYTFDGWYFGNTKITSTTALVNSGNHTLEAHWIINKYSVKFASTSACPLNTTIYAQISNINYDELIKSTAIVNPACSGYSFDGWVASGNINPDTAKYGTTNNPTSNWINGNKGTYFKNLSTTSNGTVTLTASWSTGKYTVTANANGGTMSSTTGWTLAGDSKTATKQVNYLSTYGTLPTPTRSGYVFNGWNEMSDGSGNTITSSTTVSSVSDHTIYAKWMTSVTIPTNSLCKSNLVYTGSAQVLTTTTSGTGYELSGYSQTNAGEHTITATLSSGSVWSDGTTGNKTFKCSIGKATPTITLSATSGTTVAGKTVTFNEKATVAGKFTVTSSATGKATVSQASANEIAANTNNTVTVTGVASGSATITVKFTPTDTTNYNNATNKTYSVTVASSATKPTASGYCKSGLTYSGRSQTLVNAAGTGYTWSAGTTRTAAGSQDVTASLSSGYRWSDNTTADVKISCSIGKATPTITLSATSGTTVAGKTVTFNEQATVAGKFTVTSSATGKATVSQASANEIAANTNNTVTVTGVASGSATITVKFTPTDTTNYNNATNKTYSVTVASSATKPTASGYCKSGLTYSGRSQTLVNAAGTGYTWSAGTTRTAAGSQDVTASLSSGYRWSDNTTADVKISCSIGKATPTITLSATSGTTVAGKTVTFNEQATVAGKFTVTSSATGKATVSQASANEIAANTNNKVTITGKAAGSATITVKFTPTDTSNYNNAANKTYTVTVTDASCNCNTKWRWNFTSAVNCGNGLYSPSTWTSCSDYGNCSSAAAAACLNRGGNLNTPGCSKQVSYNCGNWQSA